MKYGVLLVSNTWCQVPGMLYEQLRASTPFLHNRVPAGKYNIIRTDMIQAVPGRYTRKAGTTGMIYLAKVLVQQL